MENEDDIVIALPQLRENIQEATIDFWYIDTASKNIVEPQHYIVRVETTNAFFDIPLPSSLTSPCQVKQLLKKPGDVVQVGEALVILKPN